MNRTQQIKEFIRVSLEGDSVDLRGLGMKESLLNVGLGLIMVLVVALHLVLSLWQVVIAIALLGYDLIVRVLPRAVKEVPGDDRHKD